MKLSELKPCAACGGRIAPLWYVLRFTQAMVMPHATHQTLGLVQYFNGNLALAEAMSPEPDCVKVLGDEEPSLMREVHVCQKCFLEKSLYLAVLMEEAKS